MQDPKHNVDKLTNKKEIEKINTCIDNLSETFEDVVYSAENYFEVINNCGCCSSDNKSELFCAESSEEYKKNVFVYRNFLSHLAESTTKLNILLIEQFVDCNKDASKSETDEKNKIITALKQYSKYFSKDRKILNKNLKEVDISFKKANKEERKKRELSMSDSDRSFSRTTTELLSIIQEIKFASILNEDLSITDIA